MAIALDLPKRLHDQVECTESSHLFVVIKPGSQMSLGDFVHTRPMLRQAIVAGVAATEAFLVDLAMDAIGRQVRRPAHQRNKRLDAIPMDVGRWRLIEQGYKRRGWGLRKEVLRPYVEEQASTAPNQVGVIMSMLGVRQWSKKVDRARDVRDGSTVALLDEVTKRRNLIVHTGDRKGGGRSAIEPEEVSDYLNGLRSVVLALDEVVNS